MIDIEIEEDATIINKWYNGNMHEKVGVTLTKNWICFGDANHRISEMTHAGLTVSTFDTKIKTY